MLEEEADKGMMVVGFEVIFINRDLRRVKHAL